MAVNAVPTDIKIEINRSQPALRNPGATGSKHSRFSTVAQGDALYAAAHTDYRGSISHDASTEATFTTTSPTNISHTAAAGVKLALVFIAQHDSTDRISGVTYDGVAMTRNSTDADTAGEPGRVYVYSVAVQEGTAGAKTAAISHDGNAVVKWACVVTIIGTGAAGIVADARIIGPLNTGGGDQADPTAVSLQNVFEVSGVTPMNSMGYMVLFSGHDDLASIAMREPLDTAVQNHDFGTAVARVDRTSGRDITTQFTDLGYTATSEDACGIGILVSESQTFLESWDISSDPPARSKTFASFTTTEQQSQHCLAVSGAGAHLYFQDGNTTLYTYSLASPLTPAQVATLNATGTGGTVSVHRIGTNLHTQDATNAFVIDISTPGTPTLTSTTAGGVTGGAATGFVSPDSLAIFYPVSSNGTIRVRLVSASTFTTTTLPTESSSGNQFLPRWITWSPLYQEMLVLASFTDDAEKAHYYWLTYAPAYTGSNITPFNPYFPTLTGLVSHTASGGAIDPDVPADLCYTRSWICSGPEQATAISTIQGDYVFVFIRNDEVTNEGRLTVWDWGWHQTRQVPRLVDTIKLETSDDEPLYSLGPAVTEDSVGTLLYYAFGLTADETRSLLSWEPPEGWVELLTVQNNPGIDLTWGMQGSGPTDRVAGSGQMSFELNNSQYGGTLGQFSPDHGSLFEGFRVGAEVRLALEYTRGQAINTTGPNTTMVDVHPWVGWIFSIEPVPGAKLERRCKVTCVDQMHKFSRAKARGIPVKFDLTSDQAMGVLLNLGAADPLDASTDPWGFDGLNTLNPDTYNGDDRFDTYDTIFDRARDEKTAINGEMQKICQSERSYAYTAGGRFYLEPRGERDVKQNYGRTADQTLVVADNDILMRMTVDHSADKVINSVLSRVYPRAVDASLVVLFNLDRAETIPPRSKRKFRAQYRDPDLVASRIAGFAEVVPVVTTDYLANSSEDGTGTNYSTSIEVSILFEGNAAHVDVFNTLYNIPLYLTFFRIRGKGIYTYEPIVTLTEDRESIERFGLSELTYDLFYHEDGPSAEDAGQHVVSLYGQPRTFVKETFFWGNRSYSLTDFIFLTPVVGGVVEISETVTGLALDRYFVQGVKLRIREKQITEISLTLAPAQTDAIFLFGTSDGLEGSSLNGTDVLGSSFGG